MNYTAFNSNNNGMAANVTDLSAREAMNPGTIKAATGSREICEACGRPFRRMTTDPRLKFICGVCWPALGDTAMPAYGAKNFPPGKG